MECGYARLTVWFADPFWVGGCGEIKSMNVERLVDKVTLERVLLPYVVTPHFAYLQPKAEEIKRCV